MVKETTTKERQRRSSGPTNQLMAKRLWAGVFLPDMGSFLCFLYSFGLHVRLITDDGRTSMSPKGKRGKKRQGQSVIEDKRPKKKTVAVDSIQRII